ncbi:MAG: MIP/aquaporin family protein [Actinomycetota bacterium]
MERTMTERLAAEFVGAFALVFIGAGAVVMFTTFGLLPAGIVGVAFAFGLAIAVMVSAVGHVSGAHFNPAVTIGAWITQKIKSTDALGYIVAQLAGGAVGALLLRACLPAAVVKQAKYGVPEVVRGLSNGQGVLIEAILTFFLVWVIFATAIDPDGSFGKIAGLAIGLTVTMGVLMGGLFTGAAMNPARHFGPAIVGGNWDNWWVYWVGPIAGAIVAAAAYDGLIIRRPGSVAAEEAAHGFGAHGEETPRPTDEHP